ncbi:hypothetical protein SD80_011340 [Scytonema tolypothrichoides VB-61278]|nr:hypothetical protein SD80_011340 [Scytonema tolypothrichoides VB-61278]
MFDPRQTQINESYLSTANTVIKTSRELSKILINALTEITKVILEKLKEAREASKIAVEIGKDIYNLVPDESTPGAYKWEKVDLTNPSTKNNQETNIVLMPNLFREGQYTVETEPNTQTEPFTNYQAQIIVTKLVEDVPDLGSDYQQTSESALKITAYLESDGSDKQIVIYEQDSEGKCTTNLVTEILSQDEIIDVASVSLMKLLPPSSEILKNHSETKQLLSDSENFAATEEISLRTESPESTSSAEDNLKSSHSFEDNVVNHSQEEIAQTEPNSQAQETVTSNKKPENKTENEVNENSNRNQFFAQEPEELETKNRRRYAPEFTYQEVANSQGVEPAAQQWARQVEVPIYQIKHKQALLERYNGENKDIAETATAMLKKYSTLEQDGSRIYRSDAFVIRACRDTISIHRRSDELSGWENSLMEFKLNKKKEPKITKKPTEMLPVERQEFLMVAEHLNDNGKLPDLSNADIRDVANSLGSLAPAGTIKTLEVFKQNEMLLTLNNVLLQADKEELTVGEFTIRRSRDRENNRASLQLFKTTEEKGTQEQVRFDLTKTEAGITKEVSKMNISDYDINRVKFIAQNAQKLNLEQIFGNEQPTAAAAPPKEQPIQTAGDIPVKVHPYIAEEWANMVKHGGLDWGGAMNQGNEEILQRIKDNDGKLPIADQREMYFKILNYKTNEAQKKGETVVDFVGLKNIMNDLRAWRTQEIKIQYTPTEHIPSSQRQTVTAAAPQAKSGGVEL